MKFNFALFNHSKTGLATYYDIVNAIAGQLWDLGHEVYRDDERFHPAPIVNFMFEGFNPQINKWLLPQVVEQGYRVICIQTEQHGKKAFNNKSYVKELVERQRFYPAGIKQCLGALCLVPGEHKWTRLFNPRAFDLELGWSQFRENKTRYNAEPVYDFCFYGGYTTRRKQIFQQLEKKGYIIAYAPEYGEDLQARDNLIASSRVVIGPKPHPGWNLVSGSRWATALSIGRPGITEPHSGQSTWKQIIRFSKSYASFIDECEEVLHNWQAEYQKQYQAFKNLLGPSSPMCIEQAMKFILGDQYEPGLYERSFEQLTK